MTEEKAQGQPKESNTIVREPKPGGSQVDKSKGKGDDAINQTHESGKETGSAKDRNRPN
jgi:hypothetical protein